MNDTSREVLFIQGVVRFFRGKKRGAAVFLVILVAVILVARGVYTVPVNATGALFRFGKLVRDDVEPGIHFALPGPVHEVTVVNTAEVRSMTAGDGASFITGDENIIDVAATVQYRITSYGEYLTGSEDWEKVMGCAFTASIGRLIAEMNIDDVLTTGKSRIQLHVREDVQDILDGYGSGITILSVSISSITPPREASASFRRVADARSQRAERINRAESDRNRLLSQARGESAAMLRDARSEAEERMKRSEGTAKRFMDLEAAYAGDIGAFDLYVKSLQTTLKRAEVILVNSDDFGNFELYVTRGVQPLSVLQRDEGDIRYQDGSMDSSERFNGRPLPVLTEPREVHEKAED